MSYTIEQRGRDLVLSGVEDFSIDRVFDCGQCFRFEVAGGKVGGNGANAGEGANAGAASLRVKGVALGRLLEIEQNGGELVLKNCSPEEFDSVWKRYLALDVDYSGINALLSAHDSVMGDAVACSRGIRLLRQDGWEALCSFIISQNNNIPRIKKIIASLCEAYGEPFEAGGAVYYSFPTAERLAALSVDDIFALRTGFRAAYISDAAKKVASGEIDVGAVSTLSTDEALEYLCRIKGVGPKVASCALLFGFDRGDCFPIDVWVKRVLAKYYPGGFDHKALGMNAGLAQQYLFYYERYLAGGSGA